MRPRFLLLCALVSVVSCGKYHPSPVAEMVLVKGGALPEGSLLMGQIVEDFRIGRTEVTWGEWKAVSGWAKTKGYDLAGVGGTNRYDLAGVGGTVLYFGLPSFYLDQLPVVGVSWHQALKWCNARSEKEGKTPVYLVSGAVYRTGDSVPTVDANANGYRLPLDAEWEWAARGGVNSKGYTYSGSNVASEVAWMDANSGGGTNPVGSKKANELGLSDMSGNVWEWCWDAAGTNRRRRGGSWGNTAKECALVYQYSFPPTLSYSLLGFRIALRAAP